ncbi:enoyl-CoA hydratase-related protein [Marimonas arenosa]|uniref:Enoyl-CoA hydratase-related protein n=1 Tax=Marimonas arenosa TaxID=1795305 RepID=A0AAE3WDS0_9RHOB|nr:enoyl-CoA hydratase-related protein [Marimonas arenosa]MDQ2091381.1 enoyl-CoA hydratase-related protein [Marimonas arenosa]
MDTAARAELLQALDRAEAESEVEAVVITGQDRSFPGGIPVTEIAGGEAAPTLGEICRRIAEFSKPVVAAMRGEVVDGGLALALAAHARLAAVGTRLGLTAIRRGLVPGGGVTQRLPQLVGAGPAIEMIFAGRVLGVESGHLRGLCRRIVPRDVVGEAVEAARELAAAGFPVVQEGLPPGLSDPIGYQEALAARRAAPSALPPEAAAALTCIEAAQLLPLEAGLAMEEDLRAELRQTARAQGLIRTMALEARGPGGAAARRQLTVLGDGPTALILARRALEAGHDVVLAEQRDGGAQAGIRRIAAWLGQEVTRGQLSDAAQAAQMERLSGGPSGEMLQSAEIVIEACDAPLEMMAALVKNILSAVGGGVPVLLSSNMELQADRLASLLEARVLGLALSPHPGTGQRGLAELVVAPDADGGAVTRAAALVRRLGYGLVICPARRGLLAGRLKAAMLAASAWCVARGAGPQKVDAALGWPLGPFHQADVEGPAVQVERFAVLGWPASYGQLFDGFDHAGRKGRASGRGIFSYAQQGAAGDYDAAAQALIGEWRGGGETEALSPASIRRRVWSALFSAGLRLLDEGAALDAGDVDLAGLEALGVPRASGGPMKTGEIRGLLTVKRELEAWEADAPELWAASERLTEMVKNGEGFGF